MDAEISQAIASLREHFEMIIEANDRRYDERNKAADEALKAALVSNDQRLKVMNEFRSALGDQAARMITRAEHDATSAALGAKFDQLSETTEARLNLAIGPINEKLDTMGKPNWAAMASIASAFFVVVAGIWLVIGLKIDDTMAPLSVATEQFRTTLNIDTTRLNTLEARSAASSEADQVSRTDRIQLNDRVHVIETRTAASGEADAASRIDRAQLNSRVHDIEANVSVTLAERRQQYAVMEARLVEVETQFCASDIVRNLMHATDMRLVSMLWRKTFPDTALPTDNSYYPMVCNRGAIAGGR
jgi:3-phenylpropionate/cinnamic acid dioxygenase small subunit